MSLDDLVDSYSLYRRRPVFLHFYAAPFLLAYVAWLVVWVAYLGVDEHFELGCCGFVIIGVSQVLSVLCTHWFVSLLALATCTKESNIDHAECVLVHPTTNNGWAEIVALHRAFKVVYMYEGEERKTFKPLEYPEHSSFKEYNEAKGLETDAQLLATKQYYGSNKMEMVVPQFAELFKERATAPFFVFQVFTVGLWCLDDMWYYSLFTLMMLAIFEATLVKQQLRNLTDIRNMGNKDYFIQVYRSRRWAKINTDDLLPGDIVSIGRGADEDSRVPCDLILLRGPCIVDESMLTGESVPQLKEPLEDVNDAGKRYLDIAADGRLHILFGGTRVIQHTPPGKNASGLKGPDGGCICYVVRTGFTTSQGRLLRTIMFGVKRVTANNKETFVFILFLLIFAVAAAAYVWVKGTEDETRSRYKLALECTLILTSVIPPELPIELSLAVNNSLMALQKLGVFCTEPFRIPLAGRASVVCFDKTGTLTTDSLVVDGIAGLVGDDSTAHDTDARMTLQSLTTVPPTTTQVLVTCHSLMSLDGREMVGDPLEKACLQAAQWSLTKNEAVMPPKHIKQAPLKILQRWHFSSQLKRMLVIASYQSNSDTSHIACLKGAPETVKLYLRSAPAHYDATYERLSRQGSRVLAMAHKALGEMSTQQVREAKREELEVDMEFVGFVVISCPLKKDSKAMIKEIVDSSHSVVMITGDNALTACHVASALRFTNRKHTLLLDDKSGDWVSIDETQRLTLPDDERKQRTFLASHDICLTGDNVSQMLDEDYELFQNLLPHVRVYARMAPKQKERIITELRKLGYYTIMCGDGTNDVGALKHAHCGVALLSNPLPTETKKKEEPPKPTPQTNTLTDRQQAMANRGLTARPGSNSADRVNAHQQRVTSAQNRLQDMMKEMEEEEKAAVVRLGDASIAAPFTSKYNSIQSICHVIKQGRCTLVTTLQMFKILALNALVLAYGQSVLYLDGIKFSDYQATVQGLMLAACFLFISRSKPLTTLSRQRPLPNVLNLYTLLTVTMQFAVHLTCLITLAHASHQFEPRVLTIDLTKKFEPSLLNSVVYIMSVALQVSTFAVNYRGRPFMESLWENKPLLYSCMASGGWIMMLASGIMPEMSEQFELVPLPDQLRDMVLGMVVGDLLACFAIDRVLNYLFGDVRVPKADVHNRL